MGREISVPEAATLTLGGVKGASAYVLLGYAEREAELVPVVDPAGDGGTTSVPSRIEETFELRLGPRPKAHRRRGKGWQACAAEEAVPLARLVRLRGRWRVDKAYRRPVAG